MLIKVETLNESFIGKLEKVFIKPGVQVNNWYWSTNPDHFALEAWERQTTAGMSVEWLPTRASDESPWGVYRFRGIAPVNLRSLDDSNNGRFYALGR